MYLPRSLISKLYLNLVQTHHSLTAPILILVALEPDALCACRILTSLLKRDYVPHKIQPVSGYHHLYRVGLELVQPMRLAAGGSGGVVACIGVGGSIDLQKILGLEADENNRTGFDGVHIWIFDAARPWNLSNVFGGYPPAEPDQQNENTAMARKSSNGVDKGEIKRSYKPIQTGGIVVFDDGDIEEELGVQREAWYALEEIPELDENEQDIDKSDSDSEQNLVQSRTSTPRKRKSLSDQDGDSESEKENIRPRQRRRSNSSTSISSLPTSPKWRNTPQMLDREESVVNSTPPSNQQASSSSSHLPIQVQPSARSLRRKLIRLRRKHCAVLEAYQSLGTSYSAPISTLMYSLASELGCEDNDILWLAIVGLSSSELYGRTVTGFSLSNHDEPPVAKGWGSARGSQIRQLLRDEAQRLNPPDLTEAGREVNHGHATDVIPIHARSPTDTSIRLSPEPRFLLIRHWSLYDSMLHSPYLSAKLHIWSDAGKRRLHKLLAKMGMSLTQCKQSYTHMDMNLKKILRERLLQFAPQYGLDGLVPPSSVDPNNREGWGFVRNWGWKACLSAADVAVVIGAILEIGYHNTIPTVPTMSGTPAGSQSSGSLLTNMPNSSSSTTHYKFYAAYDALLSPSALMAAIPSAQTLHRAILRTGTALLQKRQIRHLRAFRMAVVKEGPDVALFTNPGALTKLALWVGEAVREVEKDSGKAANANDSTPLVLACIDEERGVYIVVGLGGAGGAMDLDKEKAKAEKLKAKEEKEKEREEKRRKRKSDKEEHRKREGNSNEETDEEGETEEEEEDTSGSEDEDDEKDGEGNEASRRIRRWGKGRNRFGNAFQEVVEETNARLQLDSFDHCVVEVQKEDLSGFLESLSMKAVVS